LGIWSFTFFISIFYDKETNTWHYLSQQLDPTGGWCLAHFYLIGSSPFGRWTIDPANPVVRSGELWKYICSGPGKHCSEGTIDEGTPQIVEKIKGWYVVTFHGYNYQLRQGARGVVVTTDFHVFQTCAVNGYPTQLPCDAMFSRFDCNKWSTPWAGGGCIGSGAASVLRSPRTKYLYQIIEAADVTLVCLTKPNQQWWPFGMVRWTDPNSWGASPTWAEISPSNPIVQGDHVGCALQYNSLWEDYTGEIYWAYWSLQFDANGGETCGSWFIFKLVPGPRNQLPMFPPRC